MLGFLLLPAAVIAAALLTQPKPPQDSSTIILLPDEDGSVGSLVVSNESGQQSSLNTAYSTVQTENSGALAAGITSAESVENEFGALLNATPVAPRSFTVTFESGSADTLSAQSQREIDTISAYLLTLPAPEIIVIGHTDRVGSLDDNDQLSQQRAQTVKRYIESTGLRTSSMVATGRGEREPIIETPDGVAEPKNRRVEISVR